jgi:hypothetical protein
LKLVRTKHSESVKGVTACLNIEHFEISVQLAYCGGHDQEKLIFNALFDLQFYGLA